MKNILFTSIIVALTSTSALADCSIKNDTKYDFTVTAGNVSNRSFGANHVESFAKGSITGTSKGGKSFSTTCSGSEYLVVKEQEGAVVVTKR